MRTRRVTVQWRHLVNWREAARCGEWAQHFSNASCVQKQDIHSTLSTRHSNAVLVAYNSKLETNVCYRVYG